ERESHSGVRIEAGESDAAGRLGAGERHFLGALDARLPRRAERAVELAVRRFAAEPRERLAGFLRAPVELLHPLVAEAEGRRELQLAALDGNGGREVGP